MIKQLKQQQKRNFFTLLFSFLLVPVAFLVLILVLVMLAPIVRDQENEDQI
jgi:flagellar biosynthesis/type III secretory pathway M-ring protein FliF/YscJ